MQGRWLIRIARYASVILALVMAWFLALIKPKLAWVLIAIVPWLMLGARAIRQRSLLRVLHQGLGSVMALLASAGTLLAAIFFARALLTNVDLPTAFGLLLVGAIATTLSAYLFEIASFDTRHDEDS